jgi:hypothetical protein
MGTSGLTDLSGANYNHFAFTMIEVKAPLTGIPLSSKQAFLKHFLVRSKKHQVIGVHQ